MRSFMDAQSYKFRDSFVPIQIAVGKSKLKCVLARVLKPGRFLMKNSRLLVHTLHTNYILLSLNCCGGKFCFETFFCLGTTINPKGRIFGCAQYRYLYNKNQGVAI